MCKPPTCVVARFEFDLDDSATIIIDLPGPRKNHVAPFGTTTPTRTVFQELETIEKARRKGRGRRGGGGEGEGGPKGRGKKERKAGQVSRQNWKNNNNNETETAVR